MKKILTVLVALIILIVGALTVAILTFDINKYRDQIATTLGTQTGRTVKLSGPIKLEVSSSGISVNIRDASLSNPAWASRPNMAGIGTFQLGVALMPLLQHHLVIKSLDIVNADIQLESTSGNRHNWELHPVSPTTGASEAKQSAAVPSATKATAAPAAPGEAVTIEVNELSVKDSQVAMRGEDGKLMVFKAKELTLGKTGKDMALHFAGFYNDRSIILDAKTDGQDLTSTAARPLDVVLTYANYQVIAKGDVSVAAKKAALDSYEVKSGNTVITGKLAVEWGGGRPAVIGTLQSAHLDPNDLKPQTDAAGSSSAPAPAAQPAAQSNGRVLSDTPIPLDGLKAADVAMDIDIADLSLSKVDLKNLDTKIVLSNGKLSVTPIKATLGAGTIDGQLNLDASQNPPKLGLTLKADGVNISDLFQAGGLETIITGKVNTDLNIVATGNSPHGLASTVSGSFDLVGAGGNVVSDAQDNVSNAIEKLLSGGLSSGNSALNCTVARFTAANGVVKDNGILLDTSAATVAGSGGFDLRGEVIDLIFKAKPKLVDTGGLLPPAHVGGTFAHPTYGISAASVVSTITGILGGTMPTDTIPDVTTQAGQNACLAALNRPAAPSKVVAPNVATQAVQQLGGKASTMLKGLLGQ